ncbi:hypothetical protein TNIN_317861 [Trichonephila inaurata madagascariensis]|uniref:Uncharacterized protein n=1 Tax=Trichonephila inaurata madagascariensis TaxID=2747483 RepID=A0A8X6XXM3_9ARAC|nr:hypothetical protein TNIN_317861 [Trichonephila inaurata madagascariensis]
MQTISSVSEGNFDHAYSDGSADKTIQNVHFVLPNGTVMSHAMCTGRIVSNFTSELRTINFAVDKYRSLDNISKYSGLDIFCDSRAVVEAVRL